MRIILYSFFLILFTAFTFASISYSSNQVTIDFDYVYKDVYIAQEGASSWTQKACLGTALSELWFDGCQIDMSSHKGGTYYVAAYACNYVNNQFDCNNNQWRIQKFEIPAPPLPPPNPTGKTLIPGNGWNGDTPVPTSQGSSNVIGYNKESTVQWDIVPFQTFNSKFEVGLFAFHVNGDGYNGEGINRVEFSVDNGPWITVTEPSLNPRTQAKEWWVTLDANAFSQDKQVELRAKVYPAHGQARVVTFDALYVNKFGTYDRPRVELGAGTHSIQTSSFGTLPTQGWYTIAAKSGVAREDVIVKVEGLVGPGNIKFEGVSLVAPDSKPHSIPVIIYTQENSPSIWFDDVYASGPESSFAGSSNMLNHVIFKGGLYVTDSVVRKVATPVWGWAPLWRNSHIKDYFEDGIRSPRLVVNTKISDQYHGNTGYHPDTFEIQTASWVTSHDDVIIYNVDVSNVQVQALAGGKVKNGAIVDTSIKMAQGHSAKMGYQMRNILIKNSYFSGAFQIAPEGIDVFVLDNINIDAKPWYTNEGCYSSYPIVDACSMGLTLRDNAEIPNCEFCRQK